MPSTNFSNSLGASLTILSLQKIGGYMRRIARSHFGYWCRHKDTWRSAQTNNTRSSHTSCSVHWGWWRDSL